MFQDHNIEQPHFSLVLQLKKTIQELQDKIQHQDSIINQYKKNSKITKVHQMEFQVQHLTDQNQRLMLIIEDLKGRKNKSHHVASSKKLLNQSQHKKQIKKHVATELRVTSKMGDVLKQNENLRRQLLSIKVGQSFALKKKSTINDRSCIFIEKNLLDLQALEQKQLQTEATNIKMQQKIQRLQQKVAQLQSKNEDLQRQKYLHYQLNKTVLQIE